MTSVRQCLCCGDANSRLSPLNGFKLSSNNVTVTTIVSFLDLSVNLTYSDLFLCDPCVKKVVSFVSFQTLARNHAASLLNQQCNKRLLSPPVDKTPKRSRLDEETSLEKIKPAVAHSRERGRGVAASSSTQSTAGGDRGRGVTARTQTDRLTMRYAQTDMDQNQEELRDGGTGQDQRVAFTMISPNEKKRREITEQARQGEEAYQRHKESNRLGPVSYVGTVGGGQKTQNDVRNQQARVQQSSKFDSIQKRQAARDTVKKREEEENIKKKTEQRRKAEQNQRSEVDRQQKLKEDHRQKNEAFLRRIEAEQKSKSTSKYRQPAAVKEPADDDTEGSQAAMNTPLDDRHDSELRELQQMFPMYDQETLRDILSQAGSVDDAVQLLS